MANQFAGRIDRESTLAYYGFGGWRPASSIPILLLFVLAMNALVYWGLLPARSRLRVEEEGEGEGVAAKGGGRALDLLLRVSAEEGKDSVDGGSSSLRRPLLPLPTVAPEAAAAAASKQQQQQQQGGGGGLKQKLLAADEKDLSIPQVLLESLTGTSDSALIDSRLNDAGGQHHRWQQQQQQQQQSPAGLGASSSSSGSSTLDVKDYESRSMHIQKSRGIRLLFRELVYSIPASEPGHEQRGPLMRCLSRRSSQRRGGGEDGGRRVLLKGASGRVNPGEMCALMGGSGAGT